MIYLQVWWKDGFVQTNNIWWAKNTQNHIYKMPKRWKSLSVLPCPIILGNFQIRRSTKKTPSIPTGRSFHMFTSLEVLYSNLKREKMHWFWMDIKICFITSVYMYMSVYIILYVIIGLPTGQVENMCFVLFPNIINVYSCIFHHIPWNQFPSSGMFPNIWIPMDLRYLTPPVIPCHTPLRRYG